MTVELREYWKAVRDGRRIVLVALLVALVAGTLFALLKPVVYESTVALYVATDIDADDPLELSERNAVAQQRVVSYAQALNGNVLAQDVAKQVGGAVDTENVVAQATPGTVVLTIAVRADDPDRAKDVAAAYAGAAPGVIDDLERSERGGSRVEVTLIDEAEPGEAVGRAGPLLIVILAGLLGVGAGLTMAVAWHVARRLRSTDDAASVA